MTTITYGKMPTSMPDGFSKAVNFPVLAMMDKTTGDHRRLASEGAGVRDEVLPLTIFSQPAQTGGHDGAQPAGALFEVTFDTESGVASGRGFLGDDEVGLRTLNWIASGIQNKNSVDLAEVKLLYVEDLSTDEYWIEFTDWRIAATTIVGKPAFAEAHAEVVASLLDDPMEELVASFDSFDFTMRLPEDEVTADGSLKPAFEWFHTPETSHPQKIVVEENGRVYGHLALWESCHDGVAGQCLRVPRPTDSYASFNKPGVLTDRGIVDTGPIFTFGGHRKSKSAPTIEQAYGGIENAWGDVRVTAGVHGPWISGYVRPGTDELAVIGARASRISGHWVGGRLKAIVSVNAEGFDVPGLVGGERDLVAGFSAALDDSGVYELVASFPTCLNDVDLAPVASGNTANLVKYTLSDGQLETLLAKMNMTDGGHLSFSGTPGTATTTTTLVEVNFDPPTLAVPVAQRAAMLALLLEDDDD